MKKQLPESDISTFLLLLDNIAILPIGDTKHPSQGAELQYNSTEAEGCKPALLCFLRRVAIKKQKSLTRVPLLHQQGRG